MFWVVLTLLIVGTLPFVLSWYQIKQSQEAIVDQAQKNHLIIARATADRIEAYIEKYRDLAVNLANNQAVYLKPDSPEAAAAIKSAMLTQPQIALIGLLLNDESGERQVIQLARKQAQDQLHLNEVLTSAPYAPQLISTTAGRQLQVLVPSARPLVDVALLIDVDLQDMLNPEILGEAASISLFDAAGQLLESSAPQPVAVPADWLTLFNSGVVTGGANRAQQDIDQVVAAFAKLLDMPWYVVSRQSVEFAEQSVARMKLTAWQIFLVVFLAMAVLLAMSYFSWVKPIRRIVKAQKGLMGAENSASDWQGGEVAALEHSFEALTKHINDRNALGQIFVDRYQVICPIGKGGMGSVFLGWDPKLDRHVALKTLPIGQGKGFGSRKNMSETLVQEAITAARISHRNVVSIYDVVSTESTAFIAMEYIKGESLYNLLQRNGGLPLTLTLAIAVAVLRGLHSAHKMGFVHRDVKPANVLLDINGDIKLTDFGTTTLISGLTSDTITGTPAYMAPETYQSGEVSIKSDLFAVGVVIVECLLGHNPFSGKKQNQTRHNIIKKSVVLPDHVLQQGSRELFAVLDMLLSKDPANRPESAAATAAMLVQNMPERIFWDPELAGVTIIKNEHGNENEQTVVAHS